jgi:hypothetical protein
MTLTNESFIILSSPILYTLLINILQQIKNPFIGDLLGYYGDYSEATSNAFTVLKLSVIVQKLKWNQKHAENVFSLHLNFGIYLHVQVCVIG